MASKKELEQRIYELEYDAKDAKTARDYGVTLREQLECGLTRHNSGHEGHLFQFTSKEETYISNFGTMAFDWHREKTDPDKDKVGEFKCKFCGITTTRLMTAEELKAADKLELGD